MDVISYCDQMETQLITWKAKLYDAIKKIENMGRADREKVAPNMDDLHLMLTEISKKVADLKSECPSDWRPVKKEIEIKSEELKKKYDAMDITFGMIP